VLRAGLGIADHPSPREAVEQAVAEALAGSGRPDAAFLIAGPGHGEALPGLVASAAAALETGAVVGATAHGVLAPGRELLESPSVAVLALSGIEAEGFLVADPGPDGGAAGREIAGRLAGPPRPEDLLVLFPDPRTLDAASALPALARAVAPARIVGAGSADPISGAPLQWCGDRVASGALAGLLLRCPGPPRIGVTQACRPVTELLEVTRTRGHWILGLDGRPALDVYREVARGPLARDLRRAAAFLLVAIPAEPTQAELSPGSYLARHVVGFDPDANAFALPEILPRGARLALALREPETARDDLKAMLRELGGVRPAFGVYLDCCARGGSFFGVPGLESAYLESAFPDLPLLGAYGSCEIGPVGARTELLTYTGVMALVDPD
jgi:small ligand-binding sensory domain FIST